MTRTTTSVILVALLSACAGDGSTDPEKQLPISDVAEFGSAATRKFTVIASAADGLRTPRDLAFNPDDPAELWVVNRATEGVVTVYQPGTAQQKAVSRLDSNRSHFMSQVSSIAMGAARTFATCQENPQPFMGPTLWPRDTTMYAKVNQGVTTTHHVGAYAAMNHLGSHLDMLHESPWCMGIAHERDNVYWVFDGYHRAVVRYDFRVDHGPGWHDHSDGIVRRYADARVTRVADVPGHLELDAASGMLYIADTGGKRVLRLDTRSGHVGAALAKFEPDISEHVSWELADVKALITSGLTRPSGIALAGGRIFVTDNATNEIIAFDMDGKELGRVKTPAQGIMGIVVGPDQKIWYVDGRENTVVRIDP